MSGTHSDTPMSVLHVVRPAAGGIRQHVLSMIRHSSPQQIVHSVAAPAKFLTGLPPLPLADAFSLAITPHMSPGDWPTARRLAARVSEFDVVHAHGLRAAWITTLACLVRPFPFVVTAHNVSSGGRGTQIAVRMIGRRAHTLVAVSEAVAQSLIRQGVPSEKILLIPNGVDGAYFADLPAREAERGRMGLAMNAPTVGCIARLSPEKGVDVLIKAADILPETQFLIAGDGPQRKELETMLGANTRLLGRVADTRSLLASVDALAVPSRMEGQGIVALEAMATGVPIVVSRVGGLAEMLVEEETALLVPPDDPPALAAALERLLRDSSLRQHLITQSAALVRTRYDVRQMVQSLTVLYRQVIR